MNELHSFIILFLSQSVSSAAVHFHADGIFEHEELLSSLGSGEVCVLQDGLVEGELSPKATF